LAFEPITEPPARTTDYVKEEIVKWGKVVKESGVKAE
jgi:hypothetical protein